MPRPRKNFTLRLTDQLLDDVTRFAEEEGVSVNYWISRLVAKEADRCLSAESRGSLERAVDRVGAATRKLTTPDLGMSLARESVTPIPKKKGK